MNLLCFQTLNRSRVILQKTPCNYKALFSSSSINNAGKRKETDRTKSASFVKKVDKKTQKSTTSSEEAFTGAKNPLYYKPAINIQIQPISFFSALNNHGMIFRDTTRLVVEKVLASSLAPRNKSLILNGKPGSGKSSVLLQTASSAVNAGWFVIYAGETNSWVDSSKPYLPKLTDTKYFYQWTLVSSFLQKIKSLNENDTLRSLLTLKKDFVLGKQKLSADQSIFDVLDIGIKTPSLSQEALNIVLSVLESQTDVPVMIAIDQINTFYSTTLYTNQKNVRIPAHNLLL
ncbi:hypothetical protein AYI69_g7190, partial [Smittium culicis]